VGVPNLERLALSGWPDADFHGAVNFRFTEFYEVRLLSVLGNSLRARKKIRKGSKKAYGYSEFIGNSSGSDTNASVRCEKGKPAAEGGRTALKGFLMGEAKGRWHSQEQVC